jgi:hypothetical protein
MQLRARCCVCRHWFTPNPRVKQRQKICGQQACRQELKRRSNQCWRSQHLDYFRGCYPHQKDVYGTRSDYKRRYRQQHPDYVRRNATFVRQYRRRQRQPSSGVKPAGKAVSPTSCDLQLTLTGSTTSVRISQVSHTSRDIFVTVCSP